MPGLLFGLLLASACEAETTATSSGTASSEETLDVESIAQAELFAMTESEREDLCTLYRLQGSSAVRELPWNFADAWYEEAVDEVIDELRRNCP